MALSRYDMPALFGPSPVPDRSAIPFAQVVSISFETAPEAAAGLVARFFEVAERPIITVTRIDYHQVDYLGGRGYCEIVISVAARHWSFPDPAGFAPVMWVTEPGALISGREFMGFGKLAAEMSPIVETTDGRTFDSFEHDAPLIEGRVSNLQVLGEQALARVNQSAAEVRTFGWKLIPGQGAEADLDYPTVNIMRWHYEKAWSGVGEFTIHRPLFDAAPMSSRVLDRLAGLPLLTQPRAFVAEGSAVIDRTATRRLSSAAPDAV